MARVRVYLGCSLDGVIAGPDDDLSFLSTPGLHPGPDDPPTGALDFPTLLGQVGAMLMGRHTHDVVAGFGAWPYGALPVLVATTRPLPPADRASPTVRPVQGTIGALLAEARAVAGDRDVYLDGGALVRQALDAGLVDELCLTVLPILMGAGTRLFDGLARRSDWRFVQSVPMGGMVQHTLVPRDRPAS